MSQQEEFLAFIARLCLVLIFPFSALSAGDGASYITATTVFTDGGIMQNSVGL
jgi:hypothetical protein